MTINELYIRHLSSSIRETRSIQLKNYRTYSMEEDICIQCDHETTCLLTLFLRNKARILQQAWKKWTSETVSHNYTSDLKIILSKQLDSDELRTELEIEVLYKWVIQNCDKDFTNIAHLLGR